jgi:four helix bundle protein
MHDFKKLRVWQEARVLGVEVHALTRTFPRSDRGVIASQLRRAALGIAATIAEGCGKESRGETLRYLQIAAGSASETESHLIQAADMQFIADDVSSALADRASKLQRGIRKLCRTLPP